MPKLIVLRGNSGSGKSTVAKVLRDAITEPAVLIEQDHIRRVMFKEIDGVGTRHIDFLYDAIKLCLERNFTVFL